MATMCPNHHPVDEGLEYCEECGSRVDPSAPLPAPVSTTVPSDTWTCPDCGTGQSISRFCEACGEPNRQHPDYVEVGGDHVRAEMPPEPEAVPAAAPAWTLVATADRDFFAKMQAHNGPDAPQLRFPAVYPPRAFPLDRDQVFIGRRSRSRGIDPDVDLSAAPEDSGVSHAHAAIIATGDGWALVDVGSANGTYLNGSDDPIPAENPTPLASGDRIHLGAWTTLTLKADPPG